MTYTANSSADINKVDTKEFIKNTRELNEPYKTIAK